MRSLLSRRGGESCFLPAYTSFLVSAGYNVSDSPTAFIHFILHLSGQVHINIHHTQHFSSLQIIGKTVLQIKMCAKKRFVITRVHCWEGVEQQGCQVRNSAPCKKVALAGRLRRGAGHWLVSQCKAWVLHASLTHWLAKQRLCH